MNEKQRQARQEAHRLVRQALGVAEGAFGPRKTRKAIEEDIALVTDLLARAWTLLQGSRLASSKVAR